MLQVIPQTGNTTFNHLQPSPIGVFPANLAAALPEERQKDIVRYICQNYAWPQIMERMQFESMWDTILKMYRVKLDKVESTIEESSKAGQQESKTPFPNSRVADSVVFDAIERLTDITHFVSWKDGVPIQFNIPKYFDTRKEDSFYHPYKDKIQAINALLQWNADSVQLNRKHLIAARHFYTYGIAFALSEFDFQMANITRMSSQGPQQVPEIINIGTTFEPISIRKLWLNWRLNAYDMQDQPCPFWFDETPRFRMQQNIYNAQSNPFGYVNIDKLGAATTQWLFSEPEMSSLRSAVSEMVGLDSFKSMTGGVLPNILQPEHSVEALWTFLPMLPLDPQTGDWITYSSVHPTKAGMPVPFARYVTNMFGSNMGSGAMVLLRLQRNFYPRDQIPLYGTSHLPDLDSGLYTPSMGYLLWNHYREIVTCKNQYLANKDWINNPPAWCQVSSPANNQDLNKPGSKIEVNGPNDFGWRTPFDATQSTAAMIQELREQAQTSSKSTDAILGKALGGRTSATEAQNAFQAAMSAVTTPINLFNFDIMGGFATRVWDYTAAWFPPQLLKSISGQMGFVLSPEDLWIRVGLKWDVGSTFIESIVRQNNIQYILQNSIGDPYIKRAAMWKELLDLWRFDSATWIEDGGVERENFIATDQAIKTFMGIPTIVSPDQDHQMAINVKTRFLEDLDGPFMTNPQYRTNAAQLVEQIKQHQIFLQLQVHMQQLQARIDAPPMSEFSPPAMPTLPPTPGSTSAPPPPMMMPSAPPQGGGPMATANAPVSPGQARQQTGQ